MTHAFEKGDSNRARNAYERILHANLESAVLNSHKKNKHISIGRCRHLAIVHGVRLPPYEELSQVGFSDKQVPDKLWCVPTDCKRFAKKVAEEGFCFGNHCDTCTKLLASNRCSPGYDTSSVSSDTMPASPPQFSRAASLLAEPTTPHEQWFEAGDNALQSCIAEGGAPVLSDILGAHAAWADDGPDSAAALPRKVAASATTDGDIASEADGLLLESTHLVHRVLSAEGLLGSTCDVDLSQLSDLLAHDEVLCGHDDLTSESSETEELEQYDGFEQAWGHTSLEQGDSRPVEHRHSASPDGSTASCKVRDRSCRDSSETEVSPSWTTAELEDAARAVGVLDMSTSRPRPPVGVSSDVAAAMAIATSAKDAAPETIRQARSLVRQLSEQLEPENAGEGAHEGQSGEGRPCGGKRQKTIGADVLVELACVDRMLQRVQALVEEDLANGGFRSVETLNADDADRRLNLRVVFLRCVRMLSYLNTKAANGNSLQSIGHTKADTKTVHSLHRASVDDTRLPVSSQAATKALSLSWMGCGIGALSGALRRWGHAEGPPPRPLRASWQGAGDVDWASNSKVQPLNVATLPNGKRALLMFCSPTNAPLNYDNEIRHLQRVGMLPESPPPQRGGSFDDLRRALAEVRPHILWFSGHGDARLGEGDKRSTLSFSAADGTGEIFDPLAVADELQPYLTLYGGELECVILNACSTGGREAAEGRLGDVLKRMGTPSVLCWASPAANTACAHFAAGVASSLMGVPPQRVSSPTAVSEGAGVLQGSAEGSVLSPYATAFDCGVQTIRAALMASPQPGMRTQRFELVDPTDATRVFQPADVKSRGDAYRVRSGLVGAGRVAAGEPLLLENARSPRLISQKRPNQQSRTQGRLSWLALVVLVPLLLCAMQFGVRVLTSSGPMTVEPLTSSSLPLVSLDAAGHLHLEPSALATLRAARSPLCIVGVAGPAGEGTSTLASAIASRLGPLPASALTNASEGGSCTSCHGRADEASRKTVAETPVPFSMPESDGAEGVWMRISNSPPTELAGVCASVAVLDSSAVTGRTLQPAWARFDFGAFDAAQDRLLSFMMLCTSRLVLNVRRQPKRDLLERMFEAALTTLALRPPADELSRAAFAVSTSAEAIDDCPCCASSPALLPSSCVKANALPSPPAPVASATELIMMLRDTFGHPELSQTISNAQALREWLPGGAADALEAATASWQLTSIPPPTEYDLEMLEGKVELGTTFAVALQEAARNLITQLHPFVTPGSTGVAEGSAIAAWLEHVVSKLNSQVRPAALDGGA
mmetsp:Transcript_27744/g.55829  ORF Transcript_27744/g.55829 Transcript_27744/m.55829 type:complete len:1287 (-) Transcript_27744:417-4277(-)|eukprot:CAMPEP_0174717888 /NCGR_PEP_ID=MMETSP1094-20130205/27448_1 /TAXON_ID=156173 /ORGANISM="Chrysochromulina brevifilum, Strain UTEX LB 985" /LENGTH=1286 /DNA_ID=CAMNT_0015917891 /DNA_START=29 /DNA_END=3889 /DNA_ORIENTATION=+